MLSSLPVLVNQNKCDDGERASTTGLLIRDIGDLVKKTGRRQHKLVIAPQPDDPHLFGDDPHLIDANLQEALVIDLGEAEPYGAPGKRCQ